MLRGCAQSGGRRAVVRCLVVICLVGSAAVAGSPLGNIAAPGEDEVACLSPACIEECLESADGESTVPIGPGEYALNLVIRKSMTLHGVASSPGETCLVSRLEGRPVLLVESEEAIVVVISNVTIRGARNGTGATAWGDGIRVSGNAALILRDVVVEDNDRFGVNVRDSGKADLVHVVVSENRGSGVAVSGNAKVTMKESVAARNRWSGVFVTDRGELAVQDCRFEGNVEDGIVAWKMVRVGIGRSMVSQNGSAGISIRGMVQVRVVETTIQSNAGSGVGVVGETPSQPAPGDADEFEDWYLPRQEHAVWPSIEEGMAHVSLENCTIASNEGIGMLVWGNAVVSIVGLSLVANQTGLLVGGDAVVEMSGATIEENGQGVLTRGQSALRATGCAIRRNKGTGLTVADRSQVEFMDVAVSESGAIGIDVVGTPAPNLSLIGCRIYENRGWGIRVYGQSKCPEETAPPVVLIANCVVERNSYDGLLVREWCGRVVVNRNLFLANGIYGIRVHGTGCEDVFLGVAKTTGAVVEGAGNRAPSPGEPNENRAGGVCPARLSYLLKEWGSEK